jgi:hypothetical protein
VRMRIRTTWWCRKTSAARQAGGSTVDS